MEIFVLWKRQLPIPIHEMQCPWQMHINIACPDAYFQGNRLSGDVENKIGNQLNRLLESKSFINLANNQWGNSGTYDNRYYNAFEYDANGNIESQIRHTESGLKIEDMTYQYQKDGSGNLISNRLYHINDAVADGVWADDIDDMGTFDFAQSTININNNYSFDEEGRLLRDKQEDIERIVWRVDGKVKEVIRTSTSDKKNVSFDYDAMGKRIAKHVYDNQTNLLEKSTYYLLDAQGNCMNIYEHEVTDTDVLFNLKERHIYGTSSLGIKMDTLNMFTATFSNTISTVLGRKYFHLSNHLSNNLTTINDIKIPVSTGTTVDYYDVGVVNIYDYSPFGVMLDGRTMESDFVRVSFNGMERDDEIKGSGNHYDLGLRNYDPRIGRMFSMDPRAGEYPWQTTYAYHRNSPVMTIDYLGGGDGIYVDEETGEVLGEDEHGFEDGLIHYTSKANWENYENTPYQDKSILLGKGGISKTVNIYDEISQLINESADFTINGVEIPKLDDDVTLGVDLVTSIITAAAESTANTDFKYPEPKATSEAAKNSLKNLSKAAGRFATLYTVVDKSMKLANAINNEDFNLAGHHVVTGTGYVVATRLMTTPNPYAIVAGVILWTGVSIYDSYFEPEPKK